LIKPRRPAAGREAADRTEATDGVNMSRLEVLVLMFTPSVAHAARLRRARRTSST